MPSTAIAFSGYLRQMNCRLPAYGSSKKWVPQKGGGGKLLPVHNQVTCQEPLMIFLVECGMHGGKVEGVVVVVPDPLLGEVPPVSFQWECTEATTGFHAKSRFRWGHVVL